MTDTILASAEDSCLLPAIRTDRDDSCLLPDRHVSSPAFWVWSKSISKENTYYIFWGLMLLAFKKFIYSCWEKLVVSGLLLCISCLMICVVPTVKYWMRDNSKQIVYCHILNGHYDIADSFSSSPPSCEAWANETCHREIHLSVLGCTWDYLGL